MGWADCGTDTRGRPIGYGVQAFCDAKGCDARIDRGLSYACGGMHGEDDPPGSCEGYFCPKHLYIVRRKDVGAWDRSVITICGACRDAGEKEGIWKEED